MLKKLLGLLMVAALNVAPKTIFATGAPVGDVHSGGATAGATDNLAAHSSPKATPVGEENHCATCGEQLGDLVTDYDASPEGRRPDRLRMREHLKELTQALKDLLTIKIGTPEEPEDTDDRTVALHPEKTEAAAQHRFHANCIRRWLQYRHNCPICRFNVDEEYCLRLGVKEKYKVEETNLDLAAINIAEQKGWDPNTVRGLFCAFMLWRSEGLKSYDINVSTLLAEASTSNVLKTILSTGLFCVSFYAKTSVPLMAGIIKPEFVTRYFMAPCLLFDLAMHNLKTIYEDRLSNPIIEKYSPYIVSALISAALYCELPPARSKKEMLRNVMAIGVLFMYMTSGIMMHKSYSA